MANKIKYKIPFYDLIARLKFKGIDITITQIAEIQTYFLATPVKEIPLDNLKYIITPIIARDADSQELIYNTIDDYLKYLNYPEENVPISPLNHSRRLLNKMKRRLAKVRHFALKLLWEAIKSISKIFKKYFKKKYIIIFPIFLLLQALAGGPKQWGINIEKTGPIADSNLRISIFLGTLIGIILSYFLYKKNKKVLFRNHITESIAPEYNVSYTKVYGNQEWHEPYDLDFPKNDFLIFKNWEMSAIKNVIYNPAPSGAYAFDIKRSIRQTCLNAGFRSPVFMTEPENGNLLILINNRNYQSHMLGLFEFLIDTLDKQHKRLTRYYFNRSIKVIKPIRGRSLLIEDIIDRLGYYNLIIVGDCIDLLNEEGQSISQEVLEVQKLVKSNAVITPRPLLDWSYSEAQLQKAGFNIVPGEIEAIEMLIRKIDQEYKVGRKELFNKVKDIYACSNFDFELMNDLRAYLNDDYLFQIVCSLAVYPDLRWELTIFLFSGIVKYLKDYKLYNEIKLDYNTLLKLSRIPWLQNSQLSDSLRRLLLEHLDPHIEEVARVIILNMLNDLKKVTPKSSLAFKDLQTQFDLNAFILFAFDEKKYAKYAYTESFIKSLWSNLNDWPLKDYIDNSLNSFMPKDVKNIPISVDGFIDRKIKTKGKKMVAVERTRISLGILLLILGAPILIYKSGKIFNAPWTIYQGKSTLTIENDSCSRIPKSPIVYQYLNEAFVPLNVNNIPIQYNTPIKIKIENLDTILVLDGKYQKYTVHINLCPTRQVR